jgi:hypothetical protein
VLEAPAPRLPKPQLITPPLRLKPALALPGRYVKPAGSVSQTATAPLATPPVFVSEST